MDASALLALLLGEPGQEKVKSALSDSLISSLNWGEVMQALLRKQADTSDVRKTLEALGLKIVPLSAEQAEGAAALWEKGKPYGLSLGDRVCIFLGMDEDNSVLTADKVWTEAFPELSISLVR